MKKIHLTLVLLFAMAFADAQIVSFPDINLKFLLLQSNATNGMVKDLNGNNINIDLNTDGLIQVSEAQNVSVLNFSINYNNSCDNITQTCVLDFTPLNNFTNLKELYYDYCSQGVCDFTLNINNFNLLEKISISQYARNCYSEYGACNKGNFTISNCPNLKVLSASGLNQFYYSNLPSLEVLNYGYSINNYNNSLNLTSFPNLKKINIYGIFNSFVFQNNSNLEEVFLGGNFGLADFDFSNFSNLRILSISSEGNSINVNGCLNLEEISLSSFIFNNVLNFSNLNNLKKISLGNFYHTSNNFNNQNIDFSNSNLLQEVYLEPVGSNAESSKLIGNLDLSNKPNLSILKCSNNKFSNINLENCSSLTSFVYSTNSTSKLNNLNVLGCSSLSTIDVNNQNLTTLDLSSCGNLQSVNCDNNNLEYISFKNNTNETKTFLNNPNLTYICADDIEQQSVQYIVNVYELWDTCVVGDYCSFNPNGNYNTISGNALYDNENDGCDANDEAFEFLRVNLSDGTNSGSTFTNFEGDYVFYGNAGTFTLTPQLENPTYFNVSPATTQISFANANNNTASQDFCITPNGVHNDVEVVLAQVTPARPGFDVEYSLVYKNKGNQPLSGVVSVAFDDAKLDFVSSSIIPTSNTTGSLSWNYSNLLPFENRSITFTLNVNSPQETPAVNNGDVLTFTANITPLTGDEIPEDNTFTYNQTVVGSYDPNDIYCLEGESLDPSMIGKYLHYNVRFENIGTYEAENVVVATNINPAEYDLNSMQVLNASHNVYTRINGNLVEFIFENIQLAGSPAGGHGHVLFKMKSLNSLQTNDDVTSNANIFFDYNFPIETNDATTVFETLSNQNFTKDNSVKVYPNPAKENVTISAKTNLSSITIYDAQGRIVQFVKANELEKSINISNLSNGIYILDIVSEKGRMVEKLVKE